MGLYSIPGFLVCLSIPRVSVRQLYAPVGLVTPLSSRPRSLQEGRKEMFYLTMHSTHFIYGYMASDRSLQSCVIGWL